MEEIKALKTENNQLRALAQRDSLTGLLNRGAIEKQIDQLLKNTDSGVFLMMDIDRFKYINDTYGHLTGDHVLQAVAKMMGYIFFKKDLMGRMGGDEFAVFMPGRYTEKLVEEKAERLSSRILQAGKEMGIGSNLHITAGAEFARKDDTFQSLYNRADIAMRFGKHTRKKLLSFYTSDIKHDIAHSTPDYTGTDDSADIKYIERQLKERDLADGAYCQNYHSFLSIYRFLERGLNRTGLKVQLILISLTDQHGSFVPLRERASLIKILQTSISSSLRISDIYTQYSSCQFLVMTPGIEADNMSIITNRIQNTFRDTIPERPDIVLSFSFYPLNPVRSNKPQK